MNFFARKLYLLLVTLCTVFIISACAGSNQVAPQPSERNNDRGDLTTLDRAVPNNISDEIPKQFYEAIGNGTRTSSGKPGGRYWQQKSDYDINVEIQPKKKQLIADGTITYHNNSPDTLRQIFLELAQNLHKQGSPRSGQAEITGGVQMNRFSYNGKEMQVIQQRGQSG